MTNDTRGTETDKMAILLALQREMAELKCKNEALVQNNVKDYFFFFFAITQRFRVLCLLVCSLLYCSIGDGSRIVVYKSHTEGGYGHSRHLYPFLTLLRKCTLLKYR